MLNGTYAKDLLEALLNLNWQYRSGGTGDKTNPSSSSGFLPERLYLAFFTAAPTVNASTGAVTAYTEPTCGGSGEEGAYRRAELTAYGLGGTRILSDADAVQRKIGIYDDVTDQTPSSTVTKAVARVRNHTELVMFPYTGKLTDEHAGYNAPITHFGIFPAASGGSPIFYGPLEESVTVGADRVPVILKDGLEITLG